MCLPATASPMQAPKTIWVSESRNYLWGKVAVTNGTENKNT
jgi:hypothetical protein